MPDVSVVMSVFNGASHVTSTIDSVLSQQGVQFEYIIINDGSRDKTGEILDDFARRDNRVRVMHQGNTGLTRALIRGCDAAQGEFIARQDAGDVSFPGRLAAQVNVLRNNPAVVMTSCGSRFMGPEGEILFEIRQTGAELNDGLQTLGAIGNVSHHSSVMFRRQTYEAVGGYRAEFRVAQDLDLWLRLSEAGVCWAIPNVLCEIHLRARSISASRRAEQMRATRVILRCAEARRSGGDDSRLIARWGPQERRSRDVIYWSPRRLQDAKFYYFVGSLLRARQPDKAREYFLRAVNSWFLHPKAWYRLFSNS
jgi:glycosyltransferase involved in cell wall biosynthesis